MGTFSFIIYVWYDMKAINCFVLLCSLGVIQYGFSQSKQHTITEVSELDNVVTLYLDKAKTGDEINVLYKLLQEKKNNLVDKYWNWVPDINPINPKNDPKISSRFSNTRLHPIYNRIKKHRGVDIVSRKGSPVHAAASGTIKKAKFFNGNAGHSIEIEHKYGFRTKYFHLMIFVVEDGEKVDKGQIIGFLGESGNVTGAHLHYELIKNGRYMDPYLFIK